MRFLDSLLGRSHRHAGDSYSTPLGVESLESRDMLTAVPLLIGNTLTVLGGDGVDRISVLSDQAASQLVVLDGSQEVGRFASAAIFDIVVNAGNGNDFVLIGPG